MSDNIYLSERLHKLGYMSVLPSAHSSDDLAVALSLFQTHCNLDQPRERQLRTDGTVDDKTIKMLNLDRFCGAPDIRRASDGSVIEEARWPDACSREIRLSYKFSGDKAPGLTPQETRDGFALACAAWTTIWDSPLNGKWYPELTEAWHAAAGHGEAKRTHRFWTSVDTHEIGHALGLQHTPGDRSSIMYPSASGVMLPNKTDLRQLERLGYTRGSLSLRLAEWAGERGTEIWAKLQRLIGSTLAWSYLANGICRDRLQQAYDSTITWDSGGVVTAPIVSPDPPSDPSPPSPPSNPLDKVVIKLIDAEGHETKWRGMRMT